MGINCVRRFALIIETQIFADVVPNFHQESSAVAATIFHYRFVARDRAAVGLSVGIAMLIDLLIGWGWGVPHFSAMTGIYNSGGCARAHQASQIHWRRRDRHFCDLDFVEAWKAPDQWSGRRDGCVSRA